MGILERVRALGFSADQYVVIGSGLLDAWGLRSSLDIDLVVAPELFTQLEQTGEYTKGVKWDEVFLEKDDQEIWLTWGKGNDFHSLWSQAVIIKGIAFVNPTFLIDRKRERGTKKDLSDIQLLEQYLYEHV